MTIIPMFFTPDSAQSIAVQQMPLPKPSFEELCELWQSYYMDAWNAGCTAKESVDWADFQTVF